MLLYRKLKDAFLRHKGGAEDCENGDPSFDPSFSQYFYDYPVSVNSANLILDRNIRVRVNLKRKDADTFCLDVIPYCYHNELNPHALRIIEKTYQSALYHEGDEPVRIQLAAFHATCDFRFIVKEDDPIKVSIDRFQRGFLRKGHGVTILCLVIRRVFEGYALDIKIPQVTHGSLDAYRNMGFEVTQGAPKRVGDRIWIPTYVTGKG